jgi:GNAT superfamily N-acetyltransferase
MHTIFDKDGTAYAVAHRWLDEEAVVYTVHAGDHLELVARAVLDMARGRVSEVLVWPGWRRRGVAAALYQLIECEHGKALRPSPICSVAGRPFWASPGIDLSA